MSSRALVVVLLLMALIALNARYRCCYENGSFWYALLSQLVPVLCAGLVDILSWKMVITIVIAGGLLLCDFIYQTVCHKKIHLDDDMSAIVFLTIALNPWLMLPVYVIKCANEWLKRRQISYSNRSNLIATIVLSVGQITVMPALNAGLQGLDPVSCIEMRILLYVASTVVFTLVLSLRARMKDAIRRESSV